MIYLLPNLITDFKSSFPCHNINDVYTIAFEYDKGGNLTDYKVMNINNKWIMASEYHQQNPDSATAILTLSDLIKDMTE
tara:strand:- start:3551 stop:3787 length:237 start_codon:yes stop_codon:yes gene_type:complete